jgi:leucyl aminopeptidase
MQALETSLPLVADPAGSHALHGIRPAGLDAFRAQLPRPQAAFLDGAGFAARPGELVLLPGAEGVEAAVLGLGEDDTPFAFGDVATRLPEGIWRLVPGAFDMARAVLGFCLGAYHYGAFKSAKRPPARLVTPEGCARAVSEAGAVWMVRDLINTPANLLGPAELADAVLELGRRHGAAPVRVEGEALARAYPTVAAVGAGSARPAVVAGFDWRGSEAGEGAPLVWLCGKGVCFDTGGYDLKPSSGMLRMKKDMGGAATVLGIARVLMEADLKLRLAVRVGCVENSVSGHAMRPMDVLRTRKGLTVEVGNTDAEGRLVLCDLLAEAAEASPALVLDCATLTGAARVAVGPDLPALFSNDQHWAAAMLRSGMTECDPMWQLPLWDPYESWLDSPVADINNVSARPFAGAVVAALFLRRFVAPGTPWVHLDIFAWNESARAGRPEGGEAQTVRSVCRTIEDELVVIESDRNRGVT